MKETFFNLNLDKQQRIIKAALEEFSVSGYEKTSLDNIIRRAGISKGGLYEYIESRDDLFLYLVEYCYERLYQSIYTALGGMGAVLPADPLSRTRLVSAVAVEFYINHPDIISFIVRASVVGQSDIRARIQQVLDHHFQGLYAGADFGCAVYEREQVISLLKWLLIKTRNDFLENMKSLARTALCREAYLKEWQFFLDVLGSGIYKQAGQTFAFSPPVQVQYAPAGAQAGGAKE